MDNKDSNRYNDNNSNYNNSNDNDSTGYNKLNQSNESNEMNSSSDCRDINENNSTDSFEHTHKFSSSDDELNAKYSEYSRKYEESKESKGGNGQKTSESSEYKKQRSYPSYVLTGLASGLAGALVFASVFSGNKDILKSASGSSDSNITIAASEGANIPQAVAAKTMDSVVGITTKQVREQNDIFSGMTEQVVQGVGSGVVVSEDGYVLTNSHVVADGKAEDIKVLFKDGKEKEAKLIWKDSALDLAVVKVEAKGLKAAELGNSDKMNIGETAVAIGNPLGLDFERTVTSGIISGLNRSIEVSNAYSMEGLIQTDASINKGNSGGPLLNKNGQVIGINTLKLNTGEGMGFAQPINIVKPIIDEIKKTGKFEESYIGISGGDVLKYQKSTGRDMGVEYGVLVSKVETDSPAEKAELKPGDVIVSIDGDKVESFQSLKKLLSKYKPGDNIKLGIIRDKESKDIDVKLSSPEEKAEVPLENEFSFER